MMNNFIIFRTVNVEWINYITRKLPAAVGRPETPPDGREGKTFRELAAS